MVISFLETSSRDSINVYLCVSLLQIGLLFPGRIHSAGVYEKEGEDLISFRGKRYHRADYTDTLAAGVIYN